MDPEDPLAGHLSPSLSVQEGAITWGGNRNTSLRREEALGNGLHIPPGEPDETPS